MRGFPDHKFSHCRFVLNMFFTRCFLFGRGHPLNTHLLFVEFPFLLIILFTAFYCNNDNDTDNNDEREYAHNHKDKFLAEQDKPGNRFCKRI